MTEYVYDVYTDGSANATHAVCGFTIYQNHHVINEVTRTVEACSANLSEMLAVLLVMTTYPNTPLRIYSDSEYVVKILHGEFKPKKHKELWSQLISLFKSSKSHITWVKAHNKNGRNDHIDRLVRKKLRELKTHKGGKNNVRKNT